MKQKLKFDFIDVHRIYGNVNWSIDQKIEPDDGYVKGREVCKRKREPGKGIKNEKKMKEKKTAKKGRSEKDKNKKNWKKEKEKKKNRKEKKKKKRKSEMRWKNRKMKDFAWVELKENLNPMSIFKSQEQMMG